MLQAWPQQVLEFNREWTSTLNKASWEAASSETQIRVLSFQPDQRAGLEGPPVDNLLNEIFPVLTNRNKKGTTQALQCAILTAAQIFKHPSTPGETLGFLHRTTTKQYKSIQRYKVSAFSDHVLAKVLQKLSDIDFLTYHPGFKGKGHTKGLTSLWIPTDHFKEWIVESASQLTPTRFMDATELLHLRDVDKSLEDYTDTPDILAIRKRLITANELRKAHTWTYNPMEDEIQFYIDDKCVQLTPLELECKRIFNTSFQLGGRFYCTAQGLRGTERQTLRIDGEPTIELDFKSMQPRMAYHLNGIEAPIDCYESDVIDRDIAKKIMLISLNATDKKAAILAASKDLHIPHETSKRYIEELSSKHSAIANWFFTSSWGRLQNLESQITDTTLEYATQQGIPVLPIHDSYITKTKHTFALRDILMDAYKEHLNFDPILSW